MSNPNCTLVENLGDVQNFHIVDTDIRRCSNIKSVDTDIKRRSNIKSMNFYKNFIVHTPRFENTMNTF